MATPTQSIREIVQSQPRAEAILRRFDIDACACANQTLSETCRDLQLSLEQVLEKLEQTAAHEAATQTDLATLSPSRLIQHIVRVHHRDVRQTLPRLLETAHVLAQQLRALRIEFEQIEPLMRQLHADLEEHLRKEESVLFPYIAEMDEMMLPEFVAPVSCFRRVTEPVFMMAQEHERAELLLGKLARITSGFDAQHATSPELVAFCSELRDFTAKLREHIRLEDDLLFPRAIAMEAERAQGGAR